MPSNRDSYVLPLRELEKRAIFEALDRAAIEAGWRCRIRNATAGDQFDAPCASIFKISRTSPAQLRAKIWTIVQKNCPTSLGAAWRVQKKYGAGFSPRPRINWLRAVARLKT